jgi:NADPH2:quinone reductase
MNSHYALRQRGELKSGETLCVLGARATGLAAVQIGKAMGAKVTAWRPATRSAKLPGQPADIVIGYDPGKTALTNGNGVDVAFDPVRRRCF